jgi:hypothetical protein
MTETSVLVLIYGIVISLLLVLLVITAARRLRAGYLADARQGNEYKSEGVFRFRNL